MNLRELAHLLGLSSTTVSRALNGYPEVSAATRARVEAAALEHGYRPDSRAKGLATGRSNAIAHVIPTDSTHEMVNPVFADFIAGAGEIYAARGYDMILSIVPGDDEAQVYREIAARHSVDGIMVHAPRVADPRIALLDGLAVPYVVHGRVSGSVAPYSWVDMDNRRAFERATTYLLDLGHRDIALINGLTEMDFAARRQHGYARALKARGVEVRSDLIFCAEMTELHGYSSAIAALALARPPSAFLVSSVIAAIGVRRACTDCGLTLGRDLSLVTHDDDLSYFRDGCPEPYFTCLRSPMRDHGRRAAALLLQLIDDPAAGPLSELLKADLHVGRSTGPAMPPTLATPRLAGHAR